MTVSSATATFALRAGMLMLLVLGIVVRPALGLAGELHAMEHAAGMAGGGHGHPNAAAQQGHAVAHAGDAHAAGVHDADVGHAHADAPLAGANDAAHDHGDHYQHGHDGDRHASDAVADVSGDARHADHGDHDGHGHGDAHDHGDDDADHTRGSHGLLHQADVGCSAGLLIAYGLPEAFGFAVMLPSSAWVSAPPQRSTSPFRPPIV